jgi:uncharacterized protein
VTRRHLPVRAVAVVVLGALVLGCSTGDDGESLPEFSAPVVDDADVVPDDVQRTVDAQLEAYERRSGRQVAVAVVKTTGDASIEDYTIDLAREWGVGTEGEDDGVLLLLAYEDRRMRIEVGRGVEGELTDLEAGRIIREQLRPRLQDDDVGGAVVAGTQAIRVALGDDQATAPVAPPAADEREDDRRSFPVWIVPLLFLFLGGLGGIGRRRGGSWAGPMILGGMLGGMGRGGGGGFGGGFGGGGGGGFGGGGASGDW